MSQSILEETLVFYGILVIREQSRKFRRHTNLVSGGGVLLMLLGVVTKASSHPDVPLNSVKALLAVDRCSPPTLHPKSEDKHRH